MRELDQASVVRFGHPNEAPGYQRDGKPNQGFDAHFALSIQAHCGIFLLRKSER